METLPKVALFDMDGTLVDTEHLWAEALSLLLERYGRHISARTLMSQIYGLAWPDAFATLQAAYPDLLAESSAQRLGQALCVQFDELFALMPPKIPAALRLLERLRARGVRCGIVSGSPRKTIEQNLRSLGLLDAFDLEHSVPSDDIPRGKPDPSGYLLALQRFGVTADEAIVMEDSKVGATAALAAGIRTYTCPAPTAPVQDYPEGAICLSSWDELLLP